MGCIGARDVLQRRYTPLGLGRVEFFDGHIHICPPYSTPLEVKYGLEEKSEGYNCLQLRSHVCLLLCILFL